MNDKIDFIRQKCIEANPEIVELKFGCDFTIKAENKIVRVIDSEIVTRTVGNEVSQFASIVFMDSKGTYEGSFDGNEVEVIGRPISLADVLLALHDMADYGHYVPSVDCDGYFRAETGIVIGDDKSDMQWNLRADDLREQSEGTINILYDLLQ